MNVFDKVKFEKVNYHNNLGISEEKYKELTNKTRVAQKNTGTYLLSRYEVKDEATGKIYVSENWTGDIGKNMNYPLFIEVSEEESWFDENGFIKPENK